MYGHLRLAFPTGTFRYVKDTGPGKICGDAIGISRHIGEAVAVQGEAEQDVGIVIVKFRAKGPGRDSDQRVPGAQSQVEVGVGLTISQIM